MTKRIFLPFLLLCLAFSASAQQPDPKKLDAYYSSAMTGFHQPGMSIGIVKDGKLEFAKGYGKRTLGKNESVDENTVFQLASLSKAFTAAAIGMLVDEGKLKWEDRVTDHLPEFKLYDAYVTREFTVRDLLCHRNGYLTFDGDLLWYGTSYNRREILKRFSNLAPKHGFREKYGYSNIMFIAAAVLIEEKTGQSWEQFISSRIFKPLGMTASSVDMQTFKAGGNIAAPHVHDTARTYIDYNNAAGAVGVNSNITDLSKWAMMWLNKGKYGDIQVLKEKTVRDILAAQTPQNVSAKNEENSIHLRAAACGWMLQDFRGVKMAHHSGGLPGFILNLALVPEKNMAVIVLTNGETLIPFALTNYTIETYITGKSKDWAAEFIALSQPEPLKPDVKKEPSTVLNAEELAGTFEDKMYGKATITAAKGKATLLLEPTRQLFTAELEPLNRTSYRIKFADPFLPEGKVIFNLDADGKPTSFTIDLPNPDFNFFNLKFIRQN
ncbi:MAG: serine hydrolase [Bacteroidota bacterium]